MADKVWTAEELEQMTPAEQDAVFGSSLVTDLAAAPSSFLASVRTRAQQQIAEGEPGKR